MPDQAPAAALAAATNEEDQEWVQAARRDPAAFTAIYRRYLTPIYRYIYSRVGNQADSEDLAAQVFTEALAGLNRYQEQGNFAAWLFTIAARRIIDHYRQIEPQLSLDAAMNQPASGRSLLAQVIYNENMAELSELVSQLPEEQQELLRLRFAGGLTYTEIGQVVGRSEAAVKMAMNRLLRQLQQLHTPAERERNQNERQ